MHIKYFKDSETLESLIILINKTIKENIIRKIYNERYMANYLYLNKGELFMKIDPLKFYPLSDYDTSKEEKVINQILLETEYINAPQLVIENTFLKLQSNENFNGLEESNFFSNKYKYPLKESRLEEHCTLILQTLDVGFFKLIVCIYYVLTTVLKFIS